MLKASKDWYQVTVVDGDIRLISETAIKPFYRCNIWHVRGRDRDILIDSGSGLFSLRRSVAELIDKPLEAVASHTHFDHIGCHHEFDSCLAHPLEIPVLVNPTAEKTVADKYATSEMFDILPAGGFDKDEYQIQGVDKERIKALRQGEIIDLGNRHFEVLYVPGHSPGSIALWDEKNRILFSGDAIYDGPLLADNDDSNVADYIETMKRLHELPVEQVHGGHFPSFGRLTYKKLIREFLDTYDK